MKTIKALTFVHTHITYFLFESFCFKYLPVFTWKTQLFYACSVNTFLKVFKSYDNKNEWLEAR